MSPHIVRLPITKPWPHPTAQGFISDTPPEPNVSPQLAALTHSLCLWVLNHDASRTPGAGWGYPGNPGSAAAQRGDREGRTRERAVSPPSTCPAQAPLPPRPRAPRTPLATLDSRPGRRQPRFRAAAASTPTPRPSPLTGALAPAPRPAGCRRPPRGAPPPRPPRNPRPRPRRPPPSPPPLASAAAAPARSPPGRSRPGRRPCWAPRAARCACIWPPPPALPNERKPGRRGGDALAPPETGLHGAAASVGLQWKAGAGRASPGLGGWGGNPGSGKPRTSDEGPTCGSWRWGSGLGLGRDRCQERDRL